VPPLPLSTELPAVPQASEQKQPRVYIIGYPGGRELSFSFQDNELLDHEGPPSGQPQIGGVCRVHYRAPTEGGSSGSPVFDATGWRVIALHHKGGRFGMPRLNGGAGTYAANEGLAIGPMRAALVAGGQAT
jgi:V8-like Glu-specific endopeptidase